MALNDLGAVPASSVLPIFWTSHDGTTGANEAMSALAVGDILIYKGTSMTQRSSTAGFTLLDTDGIDVDTLTGVNAISIDLGDNTDASFYAAGSFYNVILGPVTIDTQTMYIHLATFRIVAAEGIAGTPKSDVAAWLGTAAATPTVAGVPEVDVTHWLGTAAATPTVAGVPEVDLTHVAGATTNVAALATNVDAILTDTADMQPKLGTPAGASISADLLVIDNFVDGLETTIGAAGAGLTAIPTLTTAMTESYAADGAAPTAAQMLYMIWSAIAEIGISGVTMTTYKLDGTTSAMTFTLGDANTPTTRTRAT